MRNCPVCDGRERDFVFRMDYKVIDGWPLPNHIIWYKCNACGMLYGDGNFNEYSLAKYYKKYYGFGVNTQNVITRLEAIAVGLSAKYPKAAHIVDFGGGGDDGQSIFLNKLKSMGYNNLHNVGVGERIPSCDVLLASHVLEHIYDVQNTISLIDNAIVEDGIVIIDGPDATGILLHCQAPILDYHIKHINHFRLLDYLRMMTGWGFEAIDLFQYWDVRSNIKYSCNQMYFRRLNVANATVQHIEENIRAIIDKLKEIKHPVNVWGLGDVAQHVLSIVNLDVLDYIDIDPAMNGATYDGKPIKQAIENDAPIVIIAQGQQKAILDYIKLKGYTNKVIVI